MAHANRRGRMVPDAPYQTAGSPSLRGSVAAASDPSGAAGPPPTSSMACSWPRLRVERLDERHRVPHAPTAPRRSPGAWRGSRRTSTGGSKWAPGSTYQRGAATAGRDVHAAVHERRHELGVDLRLGVAAHRSRDDPRAGLAGTEQHPGEQRVQRPLAGHQDVRVVRHRG